MDTKTYVGRVYTDNTLKNNPRIVVDAMPFVMQKIRALFPSAISVTGGKYTHKSMSIPLTMDCSKDIEMIAFRFNLEFESGLQDVIHKKCEEYDHIQAQVAKIETNNVYVASDLAYKLAVALREHQITFNNLVKIQRKMLLADPIGQGKTASALSILTEPHARPAIIVVQPHLCHQWERELKRFVPDATSHIIPGFKNYPLPNVDVIITSYNRLKPWQDTLFAHKGYFKTVVFDEVHELRHTGTTKREYCSLLSSNAMYSIGLSGTPIMNYGGEIWSVLDAINPNCLGEEGDFSREWCDWGKVRDPHALHSYLVSRGLMLRRERIRTSQPDKQVISMDADLKSLKEAENVAKMLALSLLSNKIGESDQASREFDWKLREMTGISKAKPVAEFVKTLVDQGEKVILCGWHHAVYDIWREQFGQYSSSVPYRTVFYTGSESAKDKETSINRFVNGDANIFIISLRSGAGIDGLQHVCSTMVFGELDWSPQMMDQLIGRIEREGQEKQVTAYFVTVEDGADPFMIETLGVKRSQSAGVVEGKHAEGKVLEATGAKSDRVREMAKAYLASLGEKVVESVVEDGLFGKVIDLLKRAQVPTNTEDEMQIATHKILKSLTDDKTVVHREYKVGKRSRLDFLVESKDGSERIAVELKIGSGKRQEVYRQVRKYAKEANITSLVLMAPWSGVDSFDVDGIKVKVINFSKNSL